MSSALVQGLLGLKRQVCVTKVEGVPMKNYGIFLSAVIAVFIGALSTQAAPVTLADLVAGGSITQGDKLFDNFTCTGCDELVLQIITLEGITSATGENGLRFTSPEEAGAETIVTIFRYQVTVLDANFLIHDFTHTLTFDISDGGGSLSVLEALGPLSSPIATSNLTVTPGAPSATSHSNLPFDVATLLVQSTATDIGPHSGNITADQTFSQVPVSHPVPEPATWLLLGSGLAGLITFQRFRKREGE
jgi:hypothetical protein